MSVNSTAISGLNAATTDLEFIGNNIANSNTSGFKQSFVQLADNFSQGTSGAQIVNGVKVLGTFQDFGQGGFTLTGRQLDWSIRDEELFFVMRDANNGQRSYTKAGQYFIDKTGNVVDSVAQRVQGFSIVNNVTSATLSDIVVPTTPLPAQATTGIDFEINLDSTSIPPTGAFNPTDATTFNFRTDTVVFDSLGVSHSLATYYVKQPAPAVNTWQVQVEIDGVNQGAGNVVFNNAGIFQSTTLAAIPWNPGNGSVSPQNLNLTYVNATQFGSSSETRRTTQDGFASGEVTSIDIDDDGILSARYSNGQLQQIFQIATAKFPSVNGLQQAGNMSWVETNASGRPVIESGNSLGAIQSGALEESNVDLTKSLVDLITAQRFFQANSQVIRAGDTMTETIISI